MAFKTLGSPVRLGFLRQLVHGPMPIGVLALWLDVPLATASRHLGILLREGLVVRHAAHNEAVVSLAPGALARVAALIPGEAGRTPRL